MYQPLAGPARMDSPNVLTENNWTLSGPTYTGKGETRFIIDKTALKRNNLTLFGPTYTEKIL